MILTKVRNSVLALLLVAAGFWALTTTAFVDNGERAAKLFARWEAGDAAAISWSAGRDSGTMPTSGDAVGHNGFWSGTVAVHRGDLVILVVRPIAAYGKTECAVAGFGTPEADLEWKVGLDGQVTCRKVV